MIVEDAAKERSARIEEGRRQAAATEKGQEKLSNKFFHIIPHDSTKPLGELEFHNNTELNST